MSEPYLGQIRMVAFNFAPQGHAACDGQTLPISQNQSLFDILGTTYGGDGVTTFALPDLRGRVPVHVGAIPGGTARPLGESIGEETHALAVNEVPTHTHELRATNNAAPLGSLAPADKVLARGGTNFYGDFPASTPMGTGTVSNGGGGQGHENMMPYLTINFIIAISGTVPS